MCVQPFFLGFYLLFLFLTIFCLLISYLCHLFLICCFLVSPLSVCSNSFFFSKCYNTDSKCLCPSCALSLSLIQSFSPSQLAFFLSLLFINKFLPYCSNAFNFSSFQFLSLSFFNFFSLSSEQVWHVLNQIR